MKRIYLYLFVFSLLMLVFTYMYFSKSAEKQVTTIDNYKNKIERLKDSISVLEDKYFDESHFSLENNYDALIYLDKYFPDHQVSVVADSIMALNNNHDGNKLIGMPRIDDSPFVISKLKFLNHRWIIADYNNKSLNGQLLIKYFVNEDGTFSFESFDNVLYPQRVAN